MSQSAPILTEVEQLRKENDFLRGYLAKSDKDCVYCQLPAADIAQCKSGFPGCARMDDILLAIDTKSEVQAREKISQLIDRAEKAEAQVEEMKQRLDEFERRQNNGGLA